MQTPFVGDRATGSVRHCGEFAGAMDTPSSVGEDGGDDKYDGTARRASSGCLSLRTTLLPHQRDVLAWMLRREEEAADGRDPAGGVLADEMGLGKTLDCIALIASDGSKEAGIGRRVTLVVTQMTLVMQWLGEILAHTGARADDVCVYHGKGREERLSAFMSQNGSGAVVLTTYEVMLKDAMAHRNKQDAEAERCDERGDDRVHSAGHRAGGHLRSRGDARFLSVCPEHAVASRGGPSTFASARTSAYAAGCVAHATRACAGRDGGRRRGRGHPCGASIESGRAIATLYSFRWHRIVLDEAHRIKSPEGAAARAARLLRSRRRWCVTGTPYNNDIRDLASLAMFVGTAPYNRRRWWTENAGDSSALQRWRSEYLMMRTKEEILGENLPPIEYITVTVKMPPSEERLRDAILASALSLDPRRIGPRVRGDGGAILRALTGVRRACDHPLLLLGREATRGMSRLRPVAHVGCRNFKRKRRGGGEGGGGGRKAPDKTPPVAVISATPRQRGAGCIGGVDPMGYLPGKGNAGADECSVDRAAPSGSEPQGNRCSALRDFPMLARWMVGSPPMPPASDSEFVESAKTDAVGRWCSERIAAVAGSRIVAFSQWTACLDLLEATLRRRGVVHHRYDGDLHGMRSRSEVIEAFRSDAGGCVLLCSLHCAAVGLNLAFADCVVMVDWWYNPFLERQAVDRVHRIGQVRPVTVARFVMEGSVEVDVGGIQERKVEASDHALSGGSRRSYRGRRWRAGMSIPGQIRVHGLFSSLSKAASVRVDDAGHGAARSAGSPREGRAKRPRATRNEGDEGDDDTPPQGRSPSEGSTCGDADAGMERDGSMAARPSKRPRHSYDLNNGAGVSRFIVKHARVSDRVKSRTLSFA